MNASFVVNPIAGNKAYKYIDRIKSLLASKVSLTTLITKKKGDAFEFANTVSDTGMIFVASGDGTLNEVFNGLMNSDNPGQNSIPVALIPLGITNVLAKELGIPEQVEKAIDLALSATSRKISLGRINGRYFSLMAGIGFDGETVLGVKNGFIKKISGKGAHIVSGLKVLARYNPPEIRIKFDNREVPGYTAVIGNARCYGGHNYVTPKASVSKPILDICIFSGRRRRDLLRFITGVLRKKHLDYNDVIYEKAKEIEVTSDKTVHVQIDGDYFGTLPVKVDVVEDAVSLVW